MTNETRKLLEVLCDACQKARLSQPKLLHNRLKYCWEVVIPGKHNSYDDTPEQAIESAFCWVRGYTEGKKEQTPIEKSDCPLTDASLLAKQVLDCGGSGGPQDHELLAKAVLQLTVHLLEKQ